MPSIEMISQADIIRTLVNKNCMDESIMSMVLSPDCTPPKLMEKLNEAERFDLALDVSMKLGLDASPIWKTWAMRCLKARNFQSAREKFRHCFQRLRSSAGRGNPACSNLLCAILNDLPSLEEHKMSLSEEIDLIKSRKRPRDIASGPSSQVTSTIQSKPVILSECLYYLKEYGTIEDHLKFYIRNMLWQQAVKVLLDNRDRINADRFFIVEVVLRTSTTGRLDEVLAAFIEQDPEIRRAFKYYKAMYNYYTNHKRYNSLYYLQNTIGDYMAAAENQISNFFLRKPTISYKELNNRIAGLIEANYNYRNYIGFLKSSEAETDSDKASNSCSLLFASCSLEEAEVRLRTINTQIEITKNFAINEVTGYINNIEVAYAGQSPKRRSICVIESDNMAPVTLFDTDERRLTFLAALILIYYDLDCTAYFSTSGLSLTNTLIRDYKLDKVSVFKTAMRVIIEDESCDIMDNAQLLLQRLIEDHIATSKQSKAASPSKARRKSSRQVVIREVAHIVENDLSSNSASDSQSLSSSSSSQLMSNKSSLTSQSDYSQPTSRPVKIGTRESARILGDDVIKDSIRSCQEPDYKMKLAGLLSPEAKIDLYIELGKLSNAQRLACDMNRRDYVAIVLREAERMNQDHIKDVCQHWLAKH